MDEVDLSDELVVSKIFQIRNHKVRLDSDRVSQRLHVSAYRIIADQLDVANCGIKF